MIVNNNAEPEPDPATAESPFDDLSPIVKESNEYVNVEAFAIAKCAQKVLKALPTTLEDDRKDAIDQVVKRVNTALEKLQFYQDKIKVENPKAV